MKIGGAIGAIGGAVGGFKTGSSLEPMGSVLGTVAGSIFWGTLGAFGASTKEAIGQINEHRDKYHRDRVEP